MSEKAFEVLGVIALRKAEFYQKSRDKFLTDPLLRFCRDIPEKEVRKQLRTAISKVDNTLFISEREKESGEIDPSTRIEELDLDSDRIIAQVKKHLKE